MIAISDLARFSTLRRQTFPYQEAVKKMTRNEKLRVASKIPGLALV
jgi:hypothetical protein